MIASRIISSEERRIIIDALRRAAAESRSTRLAASEGHPMLSLATLEKHTRILDLLQSIQDRLASELDVAGAEIRIEVRR